MPSFQACFAGLIALVGIFGCATTQGVRSTPPTDPNYPSYLTMSRSGLLPGEEEVGTELHIVFRGDREHSILRMNIPANVVRQTATSDRSMQPTVRVQYDLPPRTSEIEFSVSNESPGALPGSRACLEDFEVFTAWLNRGLVSGRVGRDATGGCTIHLELHGRRSRF
jgi:hypothetical protein